MVETSPIGPTDGNKEARRHAVASGCTTLLFVAIGVLALTSIDRLLETSSTMLQQERRLANLERLQASLSAVQAASRAYALTGREEYLIAFNEAQTTAAGALGDVGSGGAGGREEPLLRQLPEVAQGVVRNAREVIRVHQSEGPARAQLLVASGRDLLLDDEVVRIHRVITQGIRARLAAHGEEKQGLRVRARWIVLAGTLLACILLGAGFVFVVREGRRRTEVSSQLERYAALERENTERVARLAEFGQLLHSCQTTEEVHGVLAAAADNLFAARGVLYRLRSSKNLFERSVAWGLAGPDSFDRDGCWAMRRGRAHRSGPGLTTPRCDHLAEAAGQVRCIPLTNHGETMGILVLEADDAAHADHQWVRLSSAAAEQLASALGSIALRETLRAQSIRDELTGLFNRRFFEEALERETRRALRLDRPLSLLLFDIDHFKRFNDTWGHEAGDAVLREVGTLVRTMFRTEDVGCRYGGEEFVLILSDTDLEGGRLRAEELREAVQLLRVRHNGQLLDTITLSIGLSTTAEHGATGASLLAAADHALYGAKRAGRNRVKVTDELVRPSDATASGVSKVA
jgi:diguanylate cyclase (GGDEF)-like protein